MRILMVALLSLCLTVVQTLMPAMAVASAASGAPISPIAKTHHGAKSAIAHADHAAPASIDTAAPAHDAGHHQNADDGASCCGTSSCFVFQLSVALPLATRTPGISIIQQRSERQLTDLAPLRLDRPPRTA